MYQEKHAESVARLDGKITGPVMPQTRVYKVESMKWSSHATMGFITTKDFVKHHASDPGALGYTIVEDMHPRTKELQVFRSDFYVHCFKSLLCNSATIASTMLCITQLLSSIVLGGPLVAWCLEDDCVPYQSVKLYSQLIWGAFGMYSKCSHPASQFAVAP